MPLVSASNENQATYCALMFLGVSLKIAGRRPAIFQIEYFKKGNLLQICPWLALQTIMQCEVSIGLSNLLLSVEPH